jgi:ADP-ribose pyrophosphatase YjhB (NUDIX family)
VLDLAVKTVAMGLEALANYCKKIRLYFFPEPIFLALHKLVRMTSVELVFIEDTKILLCFRGSKTPYYKNMWNIPGAYVRWNESILDAAKRVAREEVGIELESVRLLGVREWMDHPVGRPISMFYMAFATGEIEENTKRRFFSANELPKNLPPLQREFAENFLMAESRLFK